MVAIIIVASVIALLAILTYLVSNLFAEMVAHPKVMSKQQCYDQMKEHNSVNPDEVVAGLKQEPFTYHSQFGYDLRGFVVRTNKATERQKAVILCHGYTGAHYLMLAYGKHYLDMGFDLVLYDHRGHGISDRGPNTYCTMSCLEAVDLVGLAQYVKRFFNDDCIIGLHGESMGSATVMQAAPQLKDIAFVVEDCGFSSMRGQMEASLRNFHLPNFPYLTLGSAILKHRYNLDIDTVRPVDCVKDIQVPMLFCHGDNDHFVPTAMVYDVYNAKLDKKEIHLFKGSEHAQSIRDHFEEYKDVLKDFLTKYEIG